MKIYRVVNQVRRCSELCFDTTPNEKIAQCLFRDGERFEPIDRWKLEVFTLAYYPAMANDRDQMMGEVKMIRLYQAGCFGYARQVEYSTPEHDARVDRLMGFVHEIDSDFRDYLTYHWLIEAAKFINDRTEGVQRKVFFEGSIIKGSYASGEQTSLF